MRTSRQFGKVAGYLAMPLILLIISLLTPGIVFGRVTNITSLPYTASQAGSAFSETLTVSGSNLSSATSGINFTGHDIVLNLVNDTITFGTGGGSGVYGLNMNGAYNIRVEGGWICHGTSQDMASDGAIGVKFYGSPHDIYLHNIKIKVSGDNAHCIDSYAQGTGIYNLEINGGQFWSYCRRYTSRCNYDGAALRLETSTGSGSYSFKIHGARLWTGPGQGIVAMGRLSIACRAQIYNCTLLVDHRNEMYLTDDGDVCHNSANPYALHLRFLGAGSVIHDNVIRSGESYGGGRGIMVENASGTSSSFADIYNNDCNTHEGPNIHYGEDFQNFGLRIRPMDGGTVQYLHVHENKFIISGDTDPNTRDYGSHPIAGCYSGGGAGANVIIENNLFRAYAYSGTGTNSKAFMFDAASGDSTFIFRNNRLESDRYILKFGDYNQGADHLTMVNDTVRFISPRQSDARTFHVGHLGNAWDCSNDIARDFVYENGAADTNIVFATGGTLDFRLQKTLCVRVMGRDNLPVNGATVIATNHYSRQVVNGTTNADGYFRMPVSYWYESYTGSDSTSYNNFTVRARKLQDSTVITFTVSPTCPEASITLSNTGGNPGSQDTIPPGRVNDLGALPPDIQGQAFYQIDNSASDNLNIMEIYALKKTQE